MGRMVAGVALLSQVSGAQIDTDLTLPSLRRVMH